MIHICIYMLNLFHGLNGEKEISMDPTDPLLFQSLVSVTHGKCLLELLDIDFMYDFMIMYA